MSQRFTATHTAKAAQANATAKALSKNLQSQHTDEKRSTIAHQCIRAIAGAVVN
jgi:hypothetical protein